MVDIETTEIAALGELKYYGDSSVKISKVLMQLKRFFIVMKMCSRQLINF